MTSESLFVDYFDEWIDTYKRGAVRPVTLRKYELVSRHLRDLMGDVRLCDLDRKRYQQLINDFAENHERVTVADTMHMVRSAVLDAVDEGFIDRDPTRRAVIKGCEPKQRHRKKYLDQFQLQKLLEVLVLGDEPSWDWLILLIAKTGLRYSEALAITPRDFDFSKMTLSVNKTWDYKSGGGFTKTKNYSSVRTVEMDWQLSMQMQGLCRGLDPERPIFVVPGRSTYNSTANDRLHKRCREAEIPEISIHGLRHTHASILLASGVSTASVSSRLGHSNISTTQKVYLHVIKELERQDVSAIMRSMSSLT